MPEENDNEGGLEEGAEEQSYFVDNPSLDLEATSNAYEGLAKLYRLQFIAEHCPCYRVEALKLAITAVQSTYNTTLYQRLHRKLQECIGGPANAGAAGLPDVAVGAADQVPAYSQELLVPLKVTFVKISSPYHSVCGEVNCTL